MAISAENIQIMRSERISDNDDGGGQMTGIAVVSGDVNNIWDDIPRTMLAFGGVSLRKLFCAVRSANVDKFLGGHTIIQSDSVADNVSTLLFSTGDHYDERLSAQDKIEQFVVLSTRSPLRPVGTQRKGQISVVLYADEESDAPKIGEVLAFKSDVEEQYVKVTDIEFRPETYTYQDGSNLRTYSAIEFIIRISQPLERDFVGLDPSPTARHQFDVFKTQSSSIAHYYGIKPLKVAAQIGDSSVQTEGVFQSIVPTATTESVLLDQKPGLSTRVIQPCSQTLIEKNMGTLSGSNRLTLASSFTPGTLQIDIAGSVYRDAGKSLRLMSGTSRIDIVKSVVDGITGVITLTLLNSSNVIVRYIPAVAIELLPYTEALKIDVSNRQLTYVEQLSPAPMPGALRIEYQYLGSWYELKDDGTGAIVGEGATGIINYNSGSFSFVLPAEPDAGSSIIYTWARSPYQIDNSVFADSALAKIVIPLPGDVVAGSVVLSWSSGGVSHTATETGDQTLTGSATGTVLGYLVSFTPSSNALPDSDISITYTSRPAAAINLSRSVDIQTGGLLDIDLGDEDIDPASISLDLTVSVAVVTTIRGDATSTSFSSTLNFVGRSDNKLVLMHPNGFGDSRNDIVGTINTEAGVVTVDCDTLQQRVADFSESSERERVTYIEFRVQTVQSQSVSISYQNTFSPTEGQVFSVAQSDLEMQLPLGRELLVPGALIFELGGEQIVDRGDGALYKNWNEITGAGVRCGVVNYATAEMSVSYPVLRADLNNFSCNIVALASGLAAASAISYVVFRARANPLRPSGLQFLARRIGDTALLRAESQNDGSIVGAFDANNQLGELPQPAVSGGYNIPIIPVVTDSGAATGSVDYQTGVVEISFTQPVVLSSLTYNAVAYNSVPLSSEVLGLNPVKLPTNGQVPIFQPGYLVVIHNQKEIVIATPAAGQIIDCGRTNLAQVNIVDSAGVALASSQYTVDKAMGVVTLADPFNAIDSGGGALVMPLTLTHRIEDVCALSRVSIDGTLSLITQLTHDYSEGDSYVSSAIVFGTMQARIHTIFTQKVDQAGIFNDTLNSDSTVARYDDINYPILVDNKSAVQERWKIRFTNNSSFELIGETLGVVGVGSTAADFSPINPMTSLPYFTIRKDGWGAGWVTSNILRFNTDAAAEPIWAIRTVLPSTTPVETDFINIEFRGDAD